MDTTTTDAETKGEKVGGVQVKPEKTDNVQNKQGKSEDELLPDHLEDVQLKPEKIEERKEEGPSFACDLCDAEIVHQIAQELLSGLATACVDNTTGGLFKNPAAVAVDIRKEMLEYILQRSESFVAEFVILEGGQEGEVLDHPFGIISAFLDDFDSMKRNWFSRVSGWLLSEMREDRVDDFVQEMELNSFWVLDRREAIGQTILKNVDFKNICHCSQKFSSEEELAEHRTQCGFRSVICENEGCSATFSAALTEKHDSTCPFKVLPCEQKCSEYLLRQEMDRHCITVCPMKLVNCPFYSIGCQPPVVQCMISEHCSENLHSHLLYILQFIHKEASVKCLKQRAAQIEQSSFSSGLGDVKVVRFFTVAVKDIEQKLGPFDYKQKDADSKEETKAEDTTKENNKDNVDTKGEVTKKEDSEEEDTKTEGTKGDVTKKDTKEEDTQKEDMNKEDIKEHTREEVRKKEDNMEEELKALTPMILN
ncbi:hypothetical protein Ancab_030887 [Ancistrocladus abbreviatus]